MKYVEFGENRFVVKDTLRYEVFKYPGHNCNVRIKVVSNGVCIEKASVHNEYDSKKQQYVKYIINTQSSGYNMGVCVVYCFDLKNYFYLLYDSTIYSRIGLYLQNNTYSSDCLSLEGTFADPSITEELLPSLNYSGQQIFQSDFPNAAATNLSKLREYNSDDEPIPSTKRSGSGNPAVCACGYVSEFVEDNPSYVCPQCKLWKSIV